MRSLLTAMLLVVALLAGCSHNAEIQASGQMDFNVGYYRGGVPR